MANAAASQTKTKRTADAEIAVMSRIGKMIGELDGTSRARVLAYLHARYCVGGVPANGGALTNTLTNGRAGEDHAGEDAIYDPFAKIK